MTMKNISTIMMLGTIALILSGCLEEPQKTEPEPATTTVPVSTTAAPTATLLSTPTATLLATPTATLLATPTAIPAEATPAPTLKKLPSNALYVKAFMLKPVSWGAGNYEINSMKVEIFNQINDPVSIRALIMNNGLILEETSFTVSGGGGSYQFSNQKQHFTNNTNVTLRLIVRDYQPVDYEVKETSNLD